VQRREFITTAGAAQAQLLTTGSDSIILDSRPLFDISRWLYMQFMEPLGVTDSSVEAAWEYNTDDWRKDFVALTRDLAPDVIRWGGLYSRYYKWREGVGPAAKRPWMRNYVWGGKETNRVGTHEFVDLCRRTGAEPLYCVNFLGDGVERYRKTPEGDRTGNAREAADWVSYANDPSNAERRAHGHPEPYDIKLWQLGNETSYGRDGFTRDESIARTIEFARAMRQRDPSIKLIGWADRGRVPESENRALWAPELLRRAGEHIDMAAIHMMGMRPQRKDTVLRGARYQRAPEQAWQELLELTGIVEERVSEIEAAAAQTGSKAGIAITEGHLSIPPHNANPVLQEWLSAAYHARSLNVYQRHGACVKIATAADFEGNRWTVNALMIQSGVCYLNPVGSIARLFKRHNGTQGVAVTRSPAGLDIAASRTGNKFWLHVVNTNYSRAVEASFGVSGLTVTAGRVYQIAPEDLRQMVTLDEPDVFQPVDAALPNAPVLNWRFPAGAVAAVELDTV
jgi:alpha-L-arabinofuranosidase